MDRSVKSRNLLCCCFFALVSLLLTAGKCEHPSTQSLGPLPFPDDNPMTAEKIELGRKLFFDKRLSDDNTIACVDCHLPEKAFTDGKSKSNGIRGGITDRNAPSLLN